jgi:hypothetical protein
MANWPADLNDTTRGARRMGCVAPILIALIIALIAIAIGLGVLERNPSQADFGIVEAIDGRLNRESEPGTVQEIDRDTAAEWWFRVTLDRVPLGARLPLVCEWRDPSGNVAHRNRYETKPVDHLPWETHARFRFPPDAPLGRWTVRLSLQERVLQTIEFNLREGRGSEPGDHQ